MRAGLVTSTALHGLALGWLLVSLGSPDKFDVQDVEALPIELVSIEELTQVQKGAEDAPKDGPASVAPTTPPEPRPEAVNVGNKEKDQETPETETQKAAPVEEARLPDPVELPVPEPAPREEPKPVVQEKPEPETAPATEIAPKPEPKQEVTADPVEELIAKQETAPVPEEAPESLVLPQDLPVPSARPERQPAQTAKTPERKKEENTNSASAAAQTETTKEKADEVASLLNREAGSGGGSQANNNQASAGGKKTTTGNTLTTSEMDSLRGQIQACWSVPASAQGEVGLKVSVQFQLSQSATIEGRPSIQKSSGNRQLDESAIRAVARCGAQGFQLPPDKYDSWRDVVVNFDPSEMFQ